MLENIRYLLVRNVLYTLPCACPGGVLFAKLSFITFRVKSVQNACFAANLF
jgi:hypothetical protein